MKGKQVFTILFEHIFRSPHLNLGVEKMYLNMNLFLFLNLHHQSLAAFQLKLYQILKLKDRQVFFWQEYHLYDIHP